MLKKAVLTEGYVIRFGGGPGYAYFRGSNKGPMEGFAVADLSRARFYEDFEGVWWQVNQLLDGDKRTIFLASFPEVIFAQVPKEKKC